MLGKHLRKNQHNFLESNLSLSNFYQSDADPFSL